MNGECVPTRVESGGDPDTGADTASDTGSAEAEDCADGVDNDGDGEADGADSECRGRIQNVSQLRASTYFYAGNLSARGAEIRGFGQFGGSLELNGAAVSTPVGATAFAGALTSEALRVFPSVLDTGAGTLDSVDWSDEGFTGFVRVRTAFSDSEGATAAADSFDVLSQPDADHSRLLGRLYMSNVWGQATATTTAGDVCVGGYAQDWTLDDTGALTYSEGEWASYMSYWDAAGSGPRWTLGLAATDVYVQGAVVVPWGDRCLVAAPYGDVGVGPLDLYRTHADGGLLVFTIDRDQHFEVIDELYADSPVQVLASGSTEAGGAWLELGSVGLASSEGTFLGYNAFVAWDADGVREPWIGSGSSGWFRKGSRLGVGDYVALTTYRGDLTGDAAGPFGIDANLAVSRLTTAGSPWSLQLGDSDTYVGVEDVAFTLADDGNVLAAFSQDSNPVTYGTGTPEEVTVEGTVGRSERALVLLTLSP